MCSRSPVNTGLPLMRRRKMERAVSRIGSPNETTGIATATMVGDFCMPCSAQDEAYEQAATVAQENGRPIEVVTEKTQNRARQHGCGKDAPKRGLEIVLPHCDRSHSQKVCGVA